MKTLIIFIFIVTSLFFFSCENDGEINIKASLPVRTSNSNMNDGNLGNNIDTSKLPNFTNFYIPKKLLKQLSEDKILVNLHVITPTKQQTDFKIIAPKSEMIKDDKILNISFNALLEEGKKRVLIVQVGSINNDTNDDANASLMFTGGKIINIEKGKKYEPIELKPMVNISGNVLDSENNDIFAKIIAYPAFVNDKSQYSLKLTSNTEPGGNFNLSSIYNIFGTKTIENKGFRRGLFNLLLVANQNGKLGFSIVGKEYQELNEDDEQFKDEYECYVPESKCNKNINLDCNIKSLLSNKIDSCFTTQSGNFLPGVKITNDIKVYPKDSEEIKKGVVTSVSSPKFTKKVNLDGDIYNDAYYGNFFISGYNLDKLEGLNKKGDLLEATIKIYYGNDTYLEYSGPFTLYNLNKMAPAILKEYNPQVLQNRLPFFKLCEKNSIDECMPIELTNIRALTDGFGIDSSFLGVDNLQKITNNDKITKVEISQKLNAISDFTTIYSNPIKQSK